MENKKSARLQPSLQAETASANPQTTSSELKIEAKNVATAAPGAWIVQAVAMAKLKDRDGASMVGALKLARSVEPSPEHAESQFLGILGRCVIHGCDVHLLTADDQIAKHFPSGEAVPAGFETARDFLLQGNLKGGMAVLVFNDHLEILFADGTTASVEGA